MDLKQRKFKAVAKPARKFNSDVNAMERFQGSYDNIMSRIIVMSPVIVMSQIIKLLPSLK